MILFPNAKINLGLFVTEKRSDGFHNIETIFYPIPFADILEIVLQQDKGISFDSSGLALDCPIDKNLCVKAVGELQKKYTLGGVKIHLHKQIPFGAGLGGGSSDASSVLMALNKLYKLGLGSEELKKIALELGSDCPFFIEKNPAFASSRGENLTSVKVNLKGMFMVLINPQIHVSTKDAYAKIKPSKPPFDLREIGNLGVSEWKKFIRNDFEEVVIEKYPEIGNIKKHLYMFGAEFALMSGSGSSVFALFDEEQDFSGFKYVDKIIWKGYL